MADSSFDRSAFDSRLATRFAGRHLIARAAAGSTNDVAWEAGAAGGPDGLTVIADTQTHGRGRAGRTWHMVPGKGLALSVLFRGGGVKRPLAAVPLACGLALAEALEWLGARPELKWPNDVLIGGRKVAGILGESRGAGAGEGEVVIGVGVNLSQRCEEFPPELAATATSLAIEGVACTREALAAELLNALEPRWIELGTRGAAGVLDAWRERADCWGRRVRVSTPSGAVEGIARALDPDGALVLSLDDGTTTTIRAGDVEIAPAAPGAGREPSGAAETIAADATRRAP